MTRAAFLRRFVPGPAAPAPAARPEPGYYLDEFDDRFVFVVFVAIMFSVSFGLAEGVFGYRLGYQRRAEDQRAATWRASGRRFQW